MPIYYDKAKRAYRFQFNRIIEGRRHRASRLLPAGWSQAQADAYGRQEEARLYSLASGLRQDIPLIAEAVALYLTHRVPNLRNGPKGRTTAQNLALMVPWIEGRTLDALPQVARDYIAANPDLSASTLHNRLAYLRAAVRYAHKKHQLGERDYTAGMDIPVPRNQRHVYLRVEQMEELRQAIPADDDIGKDARAIVRIAFYTGLRWAAELLPRLPEDIIRVGRQAWLQTGMTKNGAPKMVPVHPAITADLKRLPFKHHQRTYYARFEEARTTLGWTDVVMHTMRHSHASALISQGETLAVVGKALAHKSPQSTTRYAHLYPEVVARAVRKMPTAKKKKTAKAA